MYVNWVVGGLAVLVLLPVISYLMVRAGTLGYLRSKRDFDKALQERNHRANRS